MTATSFPLPDPCARKKAEDHLPRLLTDITAIVDGQSQADPQFRTRRLYTRLTAGEVRRQLIAQHGYTAAELPCERTIATKLNKLGYTLTKRVGFNIIFCPSWGVRRVEMAHWHLSGKRESR